MTQILGHHHISMLTKNAKQNKQFYSDILGLRMVKKTVNQDSPNMYHLFYGDEVGSPGTELTFFEMPMAGHTQRGTNSIHLIGLLVPTKESLNFWAQRFAALDVKHEPVTRYHDYDALFFEDPDGLRLVLLSNDGLPTPDHWVRWNDSPIAIEHQILGMGPVGIVVKSLDKTLTLLRDTFGYTVRSQSEFEVIVQAVANEHWGEIIITEQDGPRERAGKGSVHHLAIRVADQQELSYWNEKLKKLGYSTTNVVERYYFKSVYFRDRNNIMFELATDGPGFTVDASISELGKKLDLPPFLESKRAEIEAALHPIED